MLPTHLTDCVCHVSFRRYRQLNFSVSSKSSKKWFLGTPVCRGRDTPDFGHEFSNRTYFRACGMWFGSVGRAPRVASEKEEEENRIAVCRAA